MFRFFKAHTFAVSVAGILIVVALFMLISALKADPLANIVTAQVERGDVKELVSVSGVVEATDTAELAFPRTGIVSQVLVDEGQEVEQGDVLAVLVGGTLTAELQDAQATLAIAVAERDELLSGPTSEARNVTDTSVTIARADLERTVAEQDAKVMNARRTLLSSGLEAITNNPSETAAAPAVSGTYLCDTEGEYHLDVYQTGTASGYSFRLTGLETGVYPASVEQPSKLGECGLRILFTDGESYSSSEWTIKVPNTEASSYPANINTYELALTQRNNAVAAATQAVELAEREQTLSNAAPRSEAIARANAKIASAQARVARMRAEIADLSIIAPFSGTITDVNILPGETVTTAPIITLLADSAFELTARIPEIDITKVELGQRAEVFFDARSNELQDALIIFVSPLATEIDGVAYYEAKLQLINAPSWLKSGLNADVNIVVDETRDVLRLPIRFVSTVDTEPTVQTLSGKTITERDIEIGLNGNDGFVEVIGLNEGDTVVAP